MIPKEATTTTTTAANSPYSDLRSSSVNPWSVATRGAMWRHRPWAWGVRVLARLPRKASVEELGQLVFRDAGAIVDNPPGAALCLVQHHAGVAAGAGFGRSFRRGA